MLRRTSKTTTSTIILKRVGEADVFQAYLCASADTTPWKEHTVRPKAPEDYPLAYRQVAGRLT